MKKKLISLITAVGMLMSMAVSLPASANYSAVTDTETGAVTYTWDFQDITEKITGGSENTSYNYNGLQINLSATSTSDYISSTGVYFNGAGGTGENDRHIIYIPERNGTLYLTGKGNNGQRWGISASTLKDDASSSKSNNEVTVSLACMAGTPYYMYANSGSNPRLTVTEVKYVTDAAVYDTNTFNLKKTNAPDIDSKYKAIGEYNINDMTVLYFGTSTHLSSNNGTDLYGDSGYLAFTPKYNGTIKLSKRERAVNGLFMSTGFPQNNDERSIGSGSNSSFNDTEILNVAANTTYCFYSKGNVSSSPTSIQSITYTYAREHDFSGIKGSNDVYSHSYTWRIGKVSTWQQTNNDSNTSNGIIDLSVHLGDSNSTITDSAITLVRSVSEDSTLNTGRSYMFVQPQYDGILNINVTFPSSGTNRIHYFDLGAVESIENIDLTQYSRNGAQIIGDAITGTKTVTQAMTAGHTYLLFTYQSNNSKATINEMSYSYDYELQTNSAVTRVGVYGDDPSDKATAYKTEFELSDKKTYINPTVSWEIKYGTTNDVVGTKTISKTYETVKEQESVLYGLIITDKEVGEVSGDAEPKDSQAKITASFESEAVATTVETNN